MNCKHDWHYPDQECPGCLATIGGQKNEASIQMGRVSELIPQIEQGDLLMNPQDFKQLKRLLGEENADGKMMTEARRILQMWERNWSYLRDEIPTACYSALDTELDMTREWLHDWLDLAQSQSPEVKRDVYGDKQR